MHSGQGNNFGEPVDAFSPTPPFSGHSVCWNPDFFSIAPVACCVLNAAGVILAANGVAEQLFGRTSDELTEEPILSFIAADDHACLVSLLNPAGASSPLPSASVEVRMERPDGTQLFVSVTASKIDPANGGSVLVVLSDVTARKEMEFAVRENEERLKHAIDATRDGIWDWDIPSGRVYYSPQWAALLGYAHEEVPQRVEFFLSSVHPLDAPEISQVLNDHLAGRTPIKQHEVRVRTKAGDYRWFFDRGRVVARNEAGEPIRMVGTITDITSRKEAEFALEESQTRTRLLIKAASLGLWDWNLVTNDVYFSPEWKWQLGYADHELPNRFEEWKSRLAPADLHRILATVHDFREGLRPSYEVEFRMLHKDGSWRWIFARADLTRDPDGKPVRMMGCHFDITERKQAEEALQESEMRLREAQAISQVGNFHWDATTNVVNWSEQLFRLHKRKREEFKPSFESYLQTVHPDDQPQVLQTLQAAMVEKSSFEHDYRIVAADGESRWVHSRGVTIVDKEGNLVGMEGTCQDISERVRVEEVHASLEAQLRESQKMEAIGTLAGGIAHDFNNILAAILGNVEIARLEVQNGSPAALKSLDDIRKAGGRARDLVQQILSFSRRQPTDRKPICLAPVIEESARLLRATLPARLTLNVHCDEDLPMVLADATQIEQVVLNLATNAMQAMQSRRGQISIQLEPRTLDASLASLHPMLRSLYEKQSTAVVCLTVRDDGPGMDAATKERIFEPFFTTRSGDSGTGLGLAVVHGIIQSHEGAILVNSQPGEGATFSVYLPATSVPHADAEIPSAPAPVQPAKPRGLAIRILYLDDDTSVLILVKRLLERRGDIVSCFVDQQEALAALRANPFGFDVVVTDYNMPGMQGLEVAREVRSIRPDLPVAVMSGFIDEELQAGAQECGVQQLIAKPFVIDDFYRAIQELSESNTRNVP